MTPDRLPRFETGNPAVDAALGRYALATERALSRSSGATPESFLGPGGHSPRRGEDAPLYGRLTGSTAPYTWDEVLPVAGGGWTPGPRSGTAYSHRPIVGLAGKVVRLFRGGDEDDWRFEWHQYPAKTVPPVTCPGTCGTVWPAKLFITDVNGTHQLDWNGGIGWTACYMFAAQSASLSCVIASGQVMVRYGMNCPTFSPCDRVSLFMDYEIRDCVFARGAFYLGNYKACPQTVNRNWVQQSTSYGTGPVRATWTFPASRLEFGTTTSPLPVSGTVTLSE
jgi:hypothetical protein